jgi:putative transposase
MDVVDCTRISSVWARRRVQSRAICPFPEQMSQVASTGSCFTRVATTSAIEILKTPYYAPRANAICERFMRSVRQECLDHLLILHEKQLQRVLHRYVLYFNQARPHQGIQQQIPEPSRSSRSLLSAGDRVVAIPILGGLHHDYQWVA